MDWKTEEILRRILPYGAWMWVNEHGEKVETLFNHRHQAMATRVNGVVVARLPIPPPDPNKSLTLPEVDLARAAGVLEPPGPPEEGTYYLYGAGECVAWRGGRMAKARARAAMREWGLDYDALWDWAKWQIRQERIAAGWPRPDPRRDARPGRGRQ